MSIEKASCELLVLDADLATSKIIETVLHKKFLHLSSFASLIDIIHQLNPEAFFLDLESLLNTNCLENLSDLKTRFPHCPIFIMVGVFKKLAIEQAFFLGADDFIRKPIDAQDLEERFHVRRNSLLQKASKEFQKIGDVIFHPSHRVASGSKGQRYFSPTEMSILECLLKAQGSMVKRQDVKEMCWGQAFISDNAVNRKIYEIRTALKAISSQVSIQTVYGKGFYLKTES